MPTLEQIRLQLEHSLADLRMMEIAQRPAEKWAAEKKAFAEGKVIQFFNRVSKSWDDVVPGWDAVHEYRIKPAPEWQPRFKVGNRVKLKHREDAAAIGEITELRTATRDYYVSHSGFAWNEDEIEPLPALPTERVALEAKDVPPGSLISAKPDPGKPKADSWHAVLHVCQSGKVWLLGCHGQPISFTFDELMKNGDLILRPGQTDWQPCSKESRAE